MDRRHFGKLPTFGLIGAEIVPGVFHLVDLARAQGSLAAGIYQEHLIAYRPDLALISYGLNDARGGMPLAEFLAGE
jgi:hypothetical protein